MAIMQSCCCWQSVRRGSYACAIYTTIYFALLASTTGMILWVESQYLKGIVSLPKSSSFLESGTMSPTTVQFNGMLLICSCCGVLCSLLLLYGLYKDHKMLLIPWIVTVITCCIIDIAHSLYMFFVTPDFNPTKLMLYTLNFFLLCLNIYSLLCVISQYQEYSAGRGTAAHDYEYRVPVVRYVTQPATTTATTSCLSSRRGITNNETKATPTQSPTACHNPLLSEKSPTGSRVSRKHVQFPDNTSSSPSQIERPETPVAEIPTKCSPKIEYNARTWLQPNDAITIVVNQSLPSSDEEHNHCS
ncbi:hypothetical protein ALC56_03383 [Trachymyrmex septentrionalis]|uniref:Uncharacterized protein n=1 Tax=Trachymyrmex septentrionalis TaxID=34720 RepID=A0A195FNW0_9HYME|nr:PREDICTED: uncharacterized protein LOC108746004 [Trachymyrmex septentrionalis]KYN42245.1 hypothetical protein ALC56_03383 [Trachymyrmex septentrionalis]